jgi:hypothetical protein
MKSSLHSLIPFLPFHLNHLRLPSPETPSILFLSEIESDSHIATDGQSVSKSWCPTPPGAHDQIFITVWQLQSFFFLWGALSDKRTGLSSVYAAGPCQRNLLGSESLGAHYHILLSQIRDFLFRRLLRLAGSQWKYSTPPQHGFLFLTCVRPSLCSLRAAPTENIASSIVECWFTAAEMWLTHRCVAMSMTLTTETSLLYFFCVFVSAGICLLSRCLAMNYSDFPASCHNFGHFIFRGELHVINPNLNKESPPLFALIVGIRMRPSPFVLRIQIGLSYLPWR